MFSLRSVGGPAAALAATGFWLVLAWRTPSSTHHFAPLIAAMLWGFIARSTDDDGRLSRAGTSWAFGGGLALAVGATIVLALADKLQGPGLYGSLPVVPELLLHSVAGAVIGARPWTLFAGAGAVSTPE